MKTKGIHPVKINFGIPVSPCKTVERFVYAYVIDGDRTCLIDTGVAGAERDISMALQNLNKKLSAVDIILLTHSHPDNMGAAAFIQDKSGARVWAHPNERSWIEDIHRQAQERPVPGFAQMVAGSVSLDRLLSEGDILSLTDDFTFKVLHTPGHSAGSICLFSEEDGILFSGDLVPQPDGMPIYEDVVALANSLVRIAEIKNLTALYSSWGEPLFGRDAVDAIHSGMRYLFKINKTLMQLLSESGDSEPMDLCRRCVRSLGLPSYAANPLVMRSFMSHREAAARTRLYSILAPFLANGSTPQ